MAKQLTKKEIIQLAQEYEELDRWTQVREWARKYYGDAAVKVEVEIEYRFNDGDPEYPSVESVEVLDAQGNSLSERDDIDEGEEEQDYDEQLPVTEESHTYDLTQEPPISFPVVVSFEPHEGYAVLDARKMRLY